jgi:hypothetical protein
MDDVDSQRKHYLWLIGVLLMTLQGRGLRWSKSRPAQPDLLIINMSLPWFPPAMYIVAVRKDDWKKSIAS